MTTVTASEQLSRQPSALAAQLAASVQPWQLSACCYSAALQVAKSMDTFFGQKDYSSFDAVVDPNVTLHKDLLILDQDVHGAEEVG